MAILVDKNTKVIVQGLTCKTGQCVDGAGTLTGLCSDTTEGGQIIGPRHEARQRRPAHSNSS